MYKVYISTWITPENKLIVKETKYAPKIKHDSKENLLMYKYADIGDKDVYEWILVELAEQWSLFPKPTNYKYFEITNENELTYEFIENQFHKKVKRSKKMNRTTK